MAEITASLVKELRERTGAGMMECKKALTESNGDIDAAAEALRKSGAAKADKKADRVAAEGRVGVAQDGGKAVLVEVNSETDFVANDVNFKNFVQTVADAALASGAADVEALKSAKLASGETVLATAWLANMPSVIACRPKGVVMPSVSMSLHLQQGKRDPFTETDAKNA